MDKSNQGNIGELQTSELDMEWVYLLLKAKKQGLQVDEIRQFFNDRTLKAI
ncbi:anti-repressor SinI family protein [Paenibacillus durus]|uniref:anti-repressor SinI family protein n=1 Tax=Paenibacillus durus TaxID=44251 RepID=UPI0004BC8264|nr:anti-repressor SinI family protein [Paenibacillus durus]